MAMVPLCRVCLSDNVTLCSVNNVHLINLYEKLTDFKYNKVGYPVSMCNICLSVLRKCHRFMETAQDSNNVLEQWYNQQSNLKVIKSRPVYSLNVTSTTTTDSLCGENFIEISPVPVIKKEERCDTDEEEEKELTIEFQKLDDGEENNIECNPGTVYDTDTNLDLDNSRTYSDSDTKPLRYNVVWLEETPHHSKDIDSHSAMETDSIRNKVKIATKTTRTILLNIAQRIKKRTYEEKSANIDNQNKISLNTRETNEQYKCEKCNKIYVNENNLRRHKDIKHGVGKQFACNLCEYKTANKYALREHRKRHSLEKPFSCHYCDFKTARKGSLKIHTRLHTNEKKYTCDVCNEKFYQIGSLQIHRKRHTNEKPFVCNVCGFMTLYKMGLEKHLSSVHNKERPFTCDICGQKFAYKKTLIRHVMVHNGEKPCVCTICSYKCVDKDLLKMHMRTHSDERPFSCHICEYKCKKKTTLASHVRTHTGEKPYACHLCDYKCSQKSALNAHLKRHKPEDISKPL